MLFCSVCVFPLFSISGVHYFRVYSLAINRSRLPSSAAYLLLRSARLAQLLRDMAVRGNIRVSGIGVLGNAEIVEKY